MALNFPARPAEPDLNSPSTYNQRVLDGFNWCFSIMPQYLEGLDAEEFFPVQTSATDTAVGRVMLNGAHGLGGETQQVKNHDFNDADASGFFHSDSTGLNKPSFASNFALLSMMRSASLHAELAIALNSGSSQNARVAVRAKTGAITWGDWFELYSQTSLLGAVSQSGGVPTGAVLQYGSNPNGEFLRLADGTQICWALGPQQTSDQANGAIFRAASDHGFTFPAAFIAAPSVSPAGRYISGGASWTVVSNTGGTGGTAGRIYSSVSGAVGNPGIIAIGRWF